MSTHRLVMFETICKIHKMETVDGEENLSALQELTMDLISIITFQPFTDFGRIRQRKY